MRSTSLRTKLGRRAQARPSSKTGHPLKIGGEAAIIGGEAALNKREVVLRRALYMAFIFSFI